MKKCEGLLDKKNSTQGENQLVQNTPSKAEYILNPGPPRHPILVNVIAKHCDLQDRLKQLEGGIPRMKGQGC